MIFTVLAALGRRYLNTLTLLHHSNQYHNGRTI
jgi:hypothetical protein